MLYEINQRISLKVKIIAEDDDEAVQAFCEMLLAPIKEIASSAKVESIEIKEGVLNVKLKDQD